MSEFPFFEIEKVPDSKTAILYMNRPDKRNAMDWSFWRDLPAVVAKLEADKDVKVVLVAGKGKSFTTGLDLESFFKEQEDIIKGETADKREELRQLILRMQSGFRAMMHGKKIYIACVHRHCIGGGLDLMCACDLRLASKDASISLRETRVAIVADIGSLNRLPQIIGDGQTRLMAFTGRDFTAEECGSMGLVSKVYDDQESMMKGAVELAAEISANPSIVLSGVKHNLNFQVGKSVDEGMDYVATFNSAFLGSKALSEMLVAFKERRRPNFD